MKQISSMIGLKKSAARPRLACEITTKRVIAGRAADRATALEVFAARELNDGSVVPNLEGNNIHDAAAIRSAISGALAPLSGRWRDVIAVLPDAAVRVLLVEFEALPAKAEERDSVIRFRLKKSLPFDVEQAALSCDIKRANGSVQVVAAVCPRDVLNEYESAFRDAGYAPGIVLPSSLASLGLVDAELPTLLLKVDAANVTVAAVVKQELRLMRTLDNPHGANVAAAELAETVLPSIVFFEDTFGARIERIFVTGLFSLEEIGPMLHQHTGAQVEQLAPKLTSGSNLSGRDFEPSMMAGVAGALLAS
jgi:type IV pilus assembly protein PilM